MLILYMYILSLNITVITLFLFSVSMCGVSEVLELSLPLFRHKCECYLPQKYRNARKRASSHSQTRTCQMNCKYINKRPTKIHSFFIYSHFILQTYLSMTHNKFSINFLCPSFRLQWYIVIFLNAIDSGFFSAQGFFSSIHTFTFQSFA